MDRILEGFSGRQTADIVGITYRQLDYWARTDLVRPTLTDATGSGSRRRYSYRDLLELKIIKTLLDAGINLGAIRHAFGYLRDQLGEDISSARLVLSGTSAVLVRDGEELIDVVNNYQGQGVLNLLSLSNVQSELDADVRRLGNATKAATKVAPKVDKDATVAALPAAVGHH